MMAISGATEKVRLLIPRLASDSDGEIIATVSAIRRVLKSNGCDLHDLAKAIGGPVYQEQPKAKKKEQPKAKTHDFNSGGDEDPYSHFTAYEWQEVVEHCEGQMGNMPPRERDFVGSMGENLERWGKPTPRQGKWLMDIFRKTGGQL